MWATLNERPGLAPGLGQLLSFWGGLTFPSTVRCMDLPAELSAYESTLTAMIRPSLEMIPVRVAAPQPPLATKLGGSPDLPPGTAWPASADGSPLPLTFQVNFTVLAERFPDLLPWPVGGGLLQFFHDRSSARTLIHRDLAALRSATDGPRHDAEYRLDPVSKGCFPDQPRDYRRFWAVRDTLGPQHTALLDAWARQFDPAPHQLGGGADWYQGPGYWQGWAQGQGLDPLDLYPGDDDGEDDDEYEAKHEQAQQNAEDRALRENWQLVFQYTPTQHTGRYYFLAPPGAAGGWDLDRIQAVFQDH
jgi:hypothetical protein